MATLVVEGDELVLRLSRWERIGAVSGDVRVPRAAVTAVTTVSPPFEGVHGLRIMGTGIPGKVALGLRRVSGGNREFVAVYGRDAGSVLIDLAGQRFSRIVVSAPDPQTVAAAVR